MKKLLLLIALILNSQFSILNSVSAQTPVDSLSQLSAAKTYTLYNPHFTAYAVYSPTGSSTDLWAAGMTGDDEHPLSNPSYAAALDPSAPSCAWMIVSYEGNTYVYNVGAQKFLCVGTTGATQATRLLDTPTPVTITSLNGGGYALRTTEGSKDYMCAAPQMAYPISVWTIDDAGSLWQIAENPDVPADSATCYALLQSRVPRLGTLTIVTRNGNIYPKTSGGSMPDQITLGQPLTISAQGMSGYSCPRGVAIRHGRNLDGPQWANDQRQWSEYTVEARKALTTIPADSVDGDLRITALWEVSNADAPELVFSDEFEGEGEPSADWWVRTQRQGATWNRWCSPSPLVVYEHGGALHCLALPTPADADDDAPMLTGGIKSQGRFDFRYGHAEARIKTRQWKGNFPAFWMMPADNSAGWPNAGEIDIFETIDTSTQSWHTVHTNWTYNLHHGPNSQTYNGLDYSGWHTFAVDWGPQAINWSVDGQRVWSYTKSTDADALAQGQWPFDAPFYLILNQSVGDGSWASSPDLDHTYETLFDWVRVYQSADITGIEGLKSEDTEIRNSQSSILNSQSVYDLQGRKVNPQSSISNSQFSIPNSQSSISNTQLPKGIYIINGKKVIIR